MSRRRSFCSSASTSASRAAFSAKNRCRVSQSRSTSARRRNSDRDSSGSIAPYPTVRPVTIGNPYNVTRSVATTLPRRFSQRGSEYVRFTR
jgi:hypothetical protein